VLETMVVVTLTDDDIGDLLDVCRFAVGGYPDDDTLQVLIAKLLAMSGALADG